MEIWSGMDLTGMTMRFFFILRKVLKRLQVLYPAKKIKVISDNSRYEPSEIEPDQIKINGKVIWFGRELER
jgi:phage repressor protein C with HTH and peptisase S24 domain